MLKPDVGILTLASGSNRFEMGFCKGEYRFCFKLPHRPTVSVMRRNLLVMWEYDGWNLLVRPLVVFK